MKVCLSCSHRFVASDWNCPACGKSPKSLNGFLSFTPDPQLANESYSPDYFPRLAALEEGHFWFTSRNELLLWALHRRFPRATSFLEIGCGTSFVLSALRESAPELSLAGSDLFPEALEFASQRNPGVQLFRMDARRIPFDDEFDVIGAFDVLEHIAEDEEVLRQLYQAVRSGGGIMLTVPHHPFLWS